LRRADEEWDARQKRTGATGRLVVYEPGDCPADEFLLRGSSGGRVVVERVFEGGKAQCAGVKVGDVLVSINGKKDFLHESANAVHLRLVPPVTLVFMGFVGDLYAEVQLSSARSNTCGLASLDQVIRGHHDSTVQFIDEVVFQPTTAGLFLTTGEQPGIGRTDIHSPFERPHPRSLYELQSADARALVRRVMLRIGFNALPSRHGVGGVTVETDQGLSVPHCLRTCHSAMLFGEEQDVSPTWTRQRGMVQAGRIPDVRERPQCDTVGCAAVRCW